MRLDSFHDMIAKSVLVSSLLLRQISSYNIFDESSSNDIGIGNRILSNGTSAKPEIEDILPSYAYAGKWKVVEAYLDEEEVSIPLKGDIILTLEESGDNITSYTLGINSFNSFGSDVIILGRDEDDGFDIIEVGVVLGTQAYPPKKYREIEDFISAELSEMNKMMVGSYDDDDDHELVMKSDNAILVCQRIPPPKTYEGTWKLMRAFNNESKVKFPESAEITLVFTERDSPYNYDWQANVYNTHGTYLNVVRTNKWGFDKILVGPVRSTLMAPPDDMKDIDTFFMTSMSSFDTMKSYEIVSGGYTELLMKGSDGHIYCQLID